jgi:hypothetical protein
MDGLIEQPFASAFHGFAVARVLFDVGNHAGIGVAGVIGGFFTVVRLAEIITFWAGLWKLRECFKINNRT